MQLRGHPRLHRILLAILCAAAMPTSTPAAQPEATTQPAGARDNDFADEPPQELVLEIGPQRIEVTAEQPFKVKVNGKTVSGRVTPKPDRLFRTAEISFRYPTDFAFAYDPTGEAPSWEFDGSTAVITVLRYDPSEKPAELVEAIAEGMIEDSEDPRARSRPVSVRWDGRAIRGKRVTSALLESTFRHDLYGFAAGNHTYVVMIQDSLSENGSPSEECTAAVELLTKTVKIAPKRSTAPATAPASEP